jgi:ATP-binding cassette, subfamily C, bacterial LapB
MSQTQKFDYLEQLAQERRVEATAPVQAALSRLEKAFHSTEMPIERNLSAAEACLRPALAALEWQGQERLIVEALPHFEHVENIDDLRAVLARLSIETEVKSASLASLTAKDLPALFSTNGYDVMVIAEVNEDDSFTIFDGTTGESKKIVPAHIAGTVYPLSASLAAEQRAEIARIGWMRFVMRRFRPALITIIAISFVVNLASLVSPLFVMHVYDMGIGTKSNSVVYALLIGALIISVTDLSLRVVRTRAMAYFAARFDSILSMSTFQQLLHLPLPMLESVPIGTQVNRLRQFEGVREAFTSSLALAIVDVPYIVVFMIAIAVIAGSLVYVPLALVAAFILLTLITNTIVRNNNAKSGEAKVNVTNLAMEMIDKRSDFRDANATEIALSRFTTASELQSYHGFKAQQINTIIRNIAGALTALAGLATLGFGTLMVMNNVLSMGALIGAMAIIWRVITPLSQVFLSLTRIEGTMSSLQQINRMMSMKPERDPSILPSFNRQFKGNIVASKVMYKYQTRHEPTLKGVSFKAERGEIIAITGPSGSGKSTLLKVLAALYQPQQGAVLAEGADIRQVDPTEWRSSIGFVPDQANFFYGTVEQNLKLGCPQASENDIKNAKTDSSLNDYAAHLPEGMLTRLTGGFIKACPEGLKQRIMLARAYVRKAPLYLMDNPTTSLDESGREAFEQKLASLRGQSTVIFVTNNHELMLKADRLIVLVAGSVVQDGKPQELLDKMMGKTKA